MPRWMLVVLLALEAHFSASYLVPLDKQSQAAFGGLLRWFWPWGLGDSGPLGRTGADSPAATVFLALFGMVLFVMAALAVLGIWVPPYWWRGLAVAGAVLSIALMLLFPSPTKLLPIAFDLLVLWIVFAHMPTVAAR